MMRLILLFILFCFLLVEGEEGLQMYDSVNQAVVASAGLAFTSDTPVGQENNRGLGSAYVIKSNIVSIQLVNSIVENWKWFRDGMYVEAWVMVQNHTVTGTTPMTLLASNTTEYEWSFGFDSKQRLTFAFHSGGDSITVSGNASIPSQKWTHIGTQIHPWNNSITFYINGVIDSRNIVDLSSELMTSKPSSYDIPGESPLISLLRIHKAKPPVVTFNTSSLPFEQYITTVSSSCILNLIVTNTSRNSGPSSSIGSSSSKKRLTGNVVTALVIIFFITISALFMCILGIWYNQKPTSDIEDRMPHCTERNRVVNTSATIAMPSSSSSHYVISEPYLCPSPVALSTNEQQEALDSLDDESRSAVPMATEVEMVICQSYPCNSAVHVCYIPANQASAIDDFV